jgi:8-oxo-dGTP diphosphatase
VAKSFPFNVRVYGIFIQNGQVLVSDEIVFGQNITKFPGGGLEFGEGPADCIRREMLEETGQAFEVVKHFYTTDFFQPSAFDPSHQVISIYYEVTTGAELVFPVSQKEFDFPEKQQGAQSFRWLAINEIRYDSFTLPVDRRVAELLRKPLG